MKQQYMIRYSKKAILGLLSTFFILLKGFAQEEDLLKMVEGNEPTNLPKQYTYATFKTTRLINFHTIESTPKRGLDFRISHRFGEMNGGGYNFWGIDGGASIRLGLEYSYDGRFQFGFGRTSYEKVFDGFLKYKLLRQTPDNKMPITLTLFTSGFYTTLRSNTLPNGVKAMYDYPASRLSYVHQIMIGRKFTEGISFQVAPTVIHYNMVEKTSDKNDVYVLAFAGRAKFTKRAAFTVEYGLRLNEYSQKSYYDSFGVGIDIETGGHVFQMHITNSFGLTESQFYARTNTSWKNLGIRLGFNVSRVFTL